MTFGTWGPALSYLFKNLAQKTAHILCPRYCFACGRLLRPEETLFCRPCSSTLPENTNPCPRCGRPLKTAEALCLACFREEKLITRVFSPFLYERPIKDLIKAYKYGQRVYLARELARLLKRLYPEELLLAQSPVCPVPLHRRRLWTRGFNQSHLLAREIFGRRRVKNFLTRPKYTRPQAGLSAKERLKNVKGAFALNEKPPPRLILFDDVLTTGATARECARTLSQAGVKEVWLAVVAATG